MVSDKVDFLAGNCMGAMPDTTNWSCLELGKLVVTNSWSTRWKQLSYGNAGIAQLIY